MSSNVLRIIKDKDVKFVDLRFTDTRGKEQHVSIPASLVDDDFFTDGKCIENNQRQRCEVRRSALHRYPR